MSETRHDARHALRLGLAALLTPLLLAGCSPPGGGFEEPQPTTGPCANLVGESYLVGTAYYCGSGWGGFSGGGLATCSAALERCLSEAESFGDDKAINCKWNGHTIYDRDFPEGTCEGGNDWRDGEDGGGDRPTQ